MTPVLVPCQHIQLATPSALLSDYSCTSMTTSCTSILITILQKYPFDIFENPILPFSYLHHLLLPSFYHFSLQRPCTSIRRFLHLPNFFYCSSLALEKSLNTTKVPPLYPPSTSVNLHPLSTGTTKVPPHIKFSTIQSIGVKVRCIVCLISYWSESLRV